MASTHTLKRNTLRLSEAMALANQHQSEGRLQESEHLLRQIIQVQPQNAFALHLLGVIAHQVGKLEIAVELILEAIRNNDEVALFHGNLGEMLRQLGKLDEAVEHGEQAVMLDANLASAHSNLGIAYFDSKDFERAHTCQQRALAINPHLASAMNNMGSICRENKDKNAAMDWYRKASAANPDYLEPLSNLGAVLQEEDRSEEAIAPLERALRINPNYAEALCNLGLVYNALNQHEKALPLLQRALQIRPDYTEACLGIARVYLDNENFTVAEQYARHAFELVTAKTEILSQLGSIYTELALSSEAESLYRRALEIDSQCNDALVGLGHLSMEYGDMVLAEKLFQQALANDADHLPARFHLAQARKAKVGDQNLAALEAAYEVSARNTEHPLSSKNAMILYFGLGKSYDDSGEYDKAFPHFLEGCRLKRATFDYDADSTSRHFDEIIRVFDQATLARLQGSGDKSQVPIFILGMPRSGTTLTEQIIASHPDVHGAGELPDLLNIAHRQLAGAIFPQNIQTLDSDQLTAWGADYVAGLQKRSPNAKHITDKMPANYYAVGLIHLMLPNAKIIHVNRNPVDTCLSCFTRLFNRKQRHTYDLAELGRYYVDYVRLMAHWRKVLPAGAFMDVQYEDIVADQEAEAHRMLDFCELEWNDACLDFYKHKRSVRTASLAQVRQPIYNSSVERWRPYEKFLGPLFDGLGDLAPK